MRLDVLLRAYRPHVESERNLVLSMWLRADCHQAVGERLGPAYYQRCEPWLRERVLPRSTIIVATLPQDTDAIVGWLASEAGVPLALLVKHGYADVRADVERQLLATLTSQERPWPSSSKA